MAIQTLCLTITYDGGRFVGSQTQATGRTVQSELQAIAELLAGDAVTLVFAGRTDRGVHAAAQIVSLNDHWPDWTEERIRRAFNAHVPEDLGVVAVERRQHGFHARFDATWREYRYRVWTGDPVPLARGTVWRRGGAPLDLAAMTDAARRLVGHHDFASLTGGGEGVPWSDRQRRPRGTVRQVLASDCRSYAPWWGPDVGGQGTEFRIIADAFLPRLVRNMVWMLVEIGRGRQSPEWVGTLLANRDRRLAGGTAPPDGLTLWRVGYNHEPIERWETSD